MRAAFTRRYRSFSHAVHAVQKTEAMQPHRCKLIQTCIVRGLPSPDLAPEIGPELLGWALSDKHIEIVPDSRQMLNPGGR